MYIPSRNIFDSVVVSIGSALIPGRHVKVLKNGVVHFSTSVFEEKWKSSDSNIASINEKTGEMKALAIGKAIINHG